MKNAARRAQIETKGARLVDEAAPGARLTWREAEGGLAATVVLPEGAPDTLKPRIEEGLSNLGATRVLVVEQGPARQPSQPAAAPRGGHDDPLRLGGARRTEPPTKSRPRGVRRVVAVASGKGGVGKSTVASRLALALAEKGERVGLLDLDVYGPSIPVMFGLSEKPALRDGAMLPLRARGLSLLSIGFLVAEDQALAWRGPMVMGAVRQLMEEADWTGEDGAPLDTLVVDTPPGTGDAHLSMIQRLALDAAVLVTTPSPLALADLRRGKQLFERTGVPVLGVVENMASLPGGPGPFGEPLSEGDLEALNLKRLASLPLDAKLAALPARTDAVGTDLLGSVADLVAAVEV
ncbi:P-loop NTPase [Parvularcula dongshanensis]|uniref:Iron-sulfur cluster carrier protein n=1 Tax=Parvularcula dongshanensis TaxID=1173995 RepID=A0A840I496_9PROT|nr:P-loop NTPase [Parvularcula dongshanensis]MBB4659155.1 ATP-binding protein involved in chromosome partitioning [Parvularcula dongshanensis]